MAAKPAAAGGPADRPQYLEDWTHAHLMSWYSELPPDDRENFKEFFENLPPGFKGSTLATYDKDDVKDGFTTATGRRFAPELYARLQTLKRANAGPPAPVVLDYQFVKRIADESAEAAVRKSARGPFGSPVPSTHNWQKNVVPPPVFAGGAIPESALLNALSLDQPEQESDLYKRWREVLPAINVADAPAVLAVTPGQSSITDDGQALFPDLVVYTADSPKTPLHVEMAGDLKLKEKVPFEAKHYNQIQRYAAAQLARQILRLFFITFLANAHSIEFFRWTRALDGGLDFIRTDALPLHGVGGWLLLHLLYGAPQVRGTFVVPPLALPGGARIAMLEQLGEGASAYAFKGTANGREMVVKLFKTTEQLECEVRHLELFAAELTGETRIPTVACIDAANQLVALSPVALKFSLRSPSFPALSALHAQWLVQTLQRIAEKKVVHRDVSPSNIYWLGDNKVMLNDFAFAVKDGEAKPYAGTVLFAADKVLEALVQNRAAPVTSHCWHDLESAVKVAAAWLLPGVRDKLLLVPHDDPQAVLAAWNQLAAMPQIPRLGRLLEAARAGRHDAIQELVIL